MKPIKNFTDHPSLKYDSVQYIFTIQNSFSKGLYLFTENKGVIQILPISAKYTNIGEPYHKLARFNFYPEHIFYHLEGTGDESIDIDLDDLPNLIKMLQAVGLKLPLDKELQKYIDNEGE